MTRSSRLRAWAEGLYGRHARDIAELIGAGEIPLVTIHVARQGPGAAWTSGADVFLSARWFSEHPDDIGGVLHEFTHAIMRAPTYDGTTIWLIEGLADYVRDELGYDAPWTKAHYEPGKATAGYQTTAHFLQHLERKYPGTVKRVAQGLMSDTYGAEVFHQLTAKSLDGCVSEYEQEATSPKG